MTTQSESVQDAQFRTWMARVDERLAEKLGGLTSADLPDCPYRDWFDDGVSTIAAAARAVKALRE